MTKKPALFIVSILSLMAFILSGCSHASEIRQNATAENSAFQELYDRSYAAKEYADKQINEFLETLNSDYTVIETAYGFVTTEEPYYIIRYKCNSGINDLFYGYKITVDDNGNCTILDEGIDTANTLFE